MRPERHTRHACLPIVISVTTAHSEITGLESILEKTITGQLKHRTARACEIVVVDGGQYVVI